MEYIYQNQRNNSQKDKQKNTRDCVGAEEIEVLNDNNVEELQGCSQEREVGVQCSDFGKSVLN